jgi:hypothetical protein
VAVIPHLYPTQLYAARRHANWRRAIPYFREKMTIFDDEY